MAPAAGSAAAIRNTLSQALGTPAPRVGQPVRVEAPGGAAIAGTVQAVDHVPQGIGVMLVLHEPVPGVLLASAMDCMGMRMATLQAYYYGPRASAAAAQQEHWQLRLLRGSTSAVSGTALTTSLAAPGGIASIVGAGDLDGDVRIDALVQRFTGSGATTTRVSYGHPNLGLESPVPMVVPEPVVNGLGYVLDVDADGIPDVLFFGTSACGGPCPGVPYMTLAMMRGLGNRSFVPSPSLQWSSGNQGVVSPGGVVEDFDRDSDPDVLILEGPGGLHRYLDNRALFGGGCLGQSGVIPAISAGTATIGNATFSIGLAEAGPFLPAGLFVSLGALPPAYCAALVSLAPGEILLPTASLGLVQTDATGTATVPLPLPSNQSLRGTTVYAQWAIVDPSGGFAAAGSNFALSRGRSILVW